MKGYILLSTKQSRYFTAGVLAFIGIGTYVPIETNYFIKYLIPGIFLILSAKTAFPGKGFLASEKKIDVHKEKMKKHPTPEHAAKQKLIEKSLAPEQKFSKYVILFGAIIIIFGIILNINPLHEFETPLIQQITIILGGIIFLYGAAVVGDKAGYLPGSIHFGGTLFQGKNAEKYGYTLIIIELIILLIGIKVIPIPKLIECIKFNENAFCI